MNKNDSVKLPVKVYEIDTDELERLESLGLEVNKEPVEMNLTVFKSHIVGYNPGTDNTTTVYLTNASDGWKVFLTFAEFEKLIYDK